MTQNLKSVGHKERRKFIKHEVDNTFPILIVFGDKVRLYLICFNNKKMYQGIWLVQTFKGFSF